MCREELSSQGKLASCPDVEGGRGVRRHQDGVRLERATSPEARDWSSLGHLHSVARSGRARASGRSCDYPRLARSIVLLRARSSGAEGLVDW